MAVTQREKSTNRVVLGPQKCYFLACHLSPESPLRAPIMHASGPAQSTAPALWPAHSQGPPRAAAVLPLARSPQSFVGFTSVTRLQMQASPDKLQCRKQTQAVIPEGTGPAETFHTLLRPCHSLQNHPRGLMLRPSQGQQSVTPQGLPALSLAQK